MSAAGGVRCRVDQNILKRSSLDGFLNCYFGGTRAVASKASIDSAMLSRSRHERKESERFKCFTYEELIKRDP